MSGFNGIGSGGDARRAHLALVEGGASISTNATSDVRLAATLEPSAIRHSLASAPRAATGYAAATGEAPRSRHESGVRAVAKNYATFDDALLPMVLASGVSGEAAASVAEAILGNPALKAQAERAFQRARINAV
ncbi:MAG: hypothetical protein JWM98_1018 [Thermoleophilia bacterium]|nr:hypothetical protein [Thermoleophilia bacterium]